MEFYKPCDTDSDELKTLVANLQIAVALPRPWSPSQQKEIDILTFHVKVYFTVHNLLQSGFSNPHVHVVESRRVEFSYDLMRYDPLGEVPKEGIPRTLEPYKPVRFSSERFYVVVPSNPDEYDDSLNRFMCLLRAYPEPPETERENNLVYFVRSDFKIYPCFEHGRNYVCVLLYILDIDPTVRPKEYTTLMEFAECYRARTIK